MARIRREARALQGKAITSFRRAADAFNSSQEDGRVTSTLLHLQHSFEMLLKAGLIQTGQRVIDPADGRSIGFAKCVNLARQHLGLGEADAGVLRATDSMRDDEQHYHAIVDEALLHAHCGAAVSIFDDLLSRVFNDRLAHHLPIRVLPLSTRPPEDIQTLIDAQFAQIQRLLRPGTRQHSSARAMVRGLLALEAHTADRVVEVSEKDVNRVVHAVRADKSREQVFPRLRTLGTESFEGGELLVKVKFVRNDPTAVPVRYVSEGEDAAAIREYDLHDKFHWSATQLAQKLGITIPKSKALRWKLDIDADETCRHDFTFGKSHFVGFSDNAFTKMRDTMNVDGFSIDEVWNEYTAGQSR